MLEAHLYNEIKINFLHQPTKDQENVIRVLAKFLVAGDDLQMLVLNGYAGTGKTSLVSAFIKTLKKMQQNVVLLAPTGRAAKVLSAYSGENAFTIHKEIYRQKSGDAFGNFDLNYNKHKDAVFIVDEASMISNTPADNQTFGSGMLLDDLIQYILTGTRCRVIFVGDKAQLPPVGAERSPALDRDALAAYGYPVAETQLKEVVRQALSSGILSLATHLRQRIDANESGYPGFHVTGFEDVVRLSGEDLIESLTTSYDRCGVEETLVITRSNKRANKYNQGIRSSILYKEEALSRGDMVMVVKNNYLWAEKEANLSFIANGDIARVQRILAQEELYDLQFADVALEINTNPTVELDVKIMKDALMAEGPSLDYSAQREFYNKVAEDYAHISRKAERSKKMKADPYFNALQIKFAYAVTCHKAQGGQWEDVYIDLGYVTEDMLNKEYMQWLYTALTRSTKRVYIVNFPEKFFAR